MHRRAYKVAACQFIIQERGACSARGLLKSYLSRDLGTSLYFAIEDVESEDLRNAIYLHFNLRCTKVLC